MPSFCDLRPDASGNAGAQGSPETCAHRPEPSFPANFGYWRVRLSLALQGRMPHTDALPHNWYDTPNIHFCTIRDFVDLCYELEIAIEKSFSLDSTGRGKQVRNGYFSSNLLGEQGIFMLSRHHRNKG